MLEEKDLQKIKEVVGDEIDDLAREIIKPSFERVENRLDKVEGRLDRIETNMVTKSYLDDKLADLEGSVVVRQRKEDNPPPFSHKCLIFLSL